MNLWGERNTIFLSSTAVEDGDQRDDDTAPSRIGQYFFAWLFAKATTVKGSERAEKRNLWMPFWGKSILFSPTSLYNFHFLGITFSFHARHPLHLHTHAHTEFRVFVEPYSLSWIWFLLFFLALLDEAAWVDVCKSYHRHFCPPHRVRILVAAEMGLCV